MYWGEFAYTKDPELVFHSSWHLHWHYSAQLWSPCLFHIIFVTFSPVFAVIYGHISVVGFWFLLSSVFVGFAQRESCLCTLVWCWCLFSCVLFLQFFKKGNSKIWDCFSHDYHSCLEWGHICTVNLSPCAGELEDGLTNCLSDFQKTFTAKKNQIGLPVVSILHSQKQGDWEDWDVSWAWKYGGQKKENWNLNWKIRKVMCWIIF